jgi:hydrogenase maturation protease
MDGKPEGSISLIEPEFAADFPSALSVHDVGLKDMIEAVYLMEELPKLYLFTISIEKIEPMCLELSPAVENCIPELSRQIMELAGRIRVKNS